MVVLKQVLGCIVHLLFLSHKSQEQVIGNKVLNASEIKLLTSSGNVLLCRFGQEMKYLRLVRKHTGIRDYISGSVDLFFDLGKDSINDAEKYREKAHSDLLEERNFQRLKNIEKNVIKNVRKLASREYVDTSEFGFPSLFVEDFYPYASSFILFLRGEITSFRNNRKILRRKPFLQTFGFNLQCATKKLADLLGLDELIPGIELRRILICGKEYFASVMDPSPGIPANAVEMEDRHKMTLAFAKSISNLDYFDAICYQTDHKQRNFNVCLSKDGKLCKVSAFDNDAPFTFLPLFSFPHKVSLIAGYTPVYKSGEICRRFMDNNLADSLCKLEKKQLFCALSDYLNELQIIAVWFRVKKLKAALRRYRKSNPAFFLDVGKDADEMQSLCSDSDEYNYVDYLANYLTNDEKEMYKHIKI